MKSTASSSKRTLLRKNLTRFAPLWGMYLMCLLLGLFMLASDSSPEYWLAHSMAALIKTMPPINAGYALLAALVLFGDLFNSRMCNALHAMPVKRGTFYAANLKAGLLFSLVPTAVMAVIAGVLLNAYCVVVNAWQLAALWWVGTNLQYLFFFGLAVFSVMLSGSRFAAAVFYGMFNFGSMLAFFLIDSLYTPLLLGVVTPLAPFYWFCPVAKLTDMDYARTNVEWKNAYQNEGVGSFTVPTEGWVYLAILAAIGAVLLVLALVLYRRRQLECAGDFLSSRKLAPVFLIVFSLLCASGFYSVFTIFLGYQANGWVMVAAGLVSGWFAALMFLRRSTRVFQPVNFLGLALLAAALGLSLYAIKVDPLGIESWVPDAQEVKAVHLDYGYGAGYDAKNSAEIADMLRIHALALEDHLEGTQEAVNTAPILSDNPEGRRAVPVRLIYHLEGGWTAQRDYTIWLDDEEGDLAKHYLSSICAVFGNVYENNGSESHIASREELLRMAAPAQQITLDSVNLPEEYLTEEAVRSLLEAIADDCEAGTTTQHYSYHAPILSVGENPSHPDAWDVEGFSLWIDFANRSIPLTVFGDCENTMSWLKQTGVLEQVLEKYEHYTLYDWFSIQ